MKHKKFSFRELTILIAGIMVVIILGACLVGVNRWVAGNYGRGLDFLPAWNGARGFLFENIDPYTRTIAERTQIVAYGRTAQDGEAPFLLDIPFPLLLIFFPIAVIPDPEWARAVWMTLAELAVMVLCICALRLADWYLNRWFTTALLVFSLTWFYSVISILNGSLSVFLMLAMVGALLAIRGGNDELAGFLMAISAVKWEITSLLWIMIIIGIYTSRRWRVFLGAGMTWFVLGVVSYLLYPGWFWPYLRSVAGNWRESKFIYPRNLVDAWLPNSGEGFALLFTTSLLLMLLLEWFAALRSRDFRRIGWTAAFAIAITPLSGFPLDISNTAPVLFSVAFIFPLVWERWLKHPRLAILTLGVVLFVAPLMSMWLEKTNIDLANGLRYIFPSFFVILYLYWLRWTLVHPPRTWLDEVKRDLRK